MRTYVTGQLVALALPGSPASGSASVTVETPGAHADGDATVDRHAVKAFIARVRLMRPEVYVTDFVTPVPELVDTVEISERLDDLVVVASFTLAKAEASPFHADALLLGNRPCRIELWIGPPGGVGTVNYTKGGSVGLGGPPAADFLDGLPHAAVIGPGGLAKYALFDGYTDALSDSAAYRPRARVQAISLSSLWADVVGCVQLAAFSNQTRAEIVAAMAESAGVTVGGLEALASARVRKPVDEMGTSVLGLIKRYGEIEGWRARLSRDGAGIEVLSEDTILSGSPAYEFDEGNTFNVGVSTPARPVTDWVLSGTRISKPNPDVALEDEGPTTKQTVTEGLDGAGLPIRMVETVDSWGGAERKRVSETYRTVGLDGVTPAPPAFQLTDRVTIRTEWADFAWYDNPAAHTGLHLRPSAQMSSRVTETETLGGTPASSDFATTYSWGGGLWLAPLAELTLIERVTESFTWNTEKCRLEASSKVTARLFSARVDAEETTSFAYPDGTDRAEDFYILQEVERSDVAWSELSEAGSAPKTTMQDSHSAWCELPSPPNPATLIDVYKVADIGTIVWQGNLADNQYTQTTTVISLGMMNTTETITVDGPCPGAPRGTTEQATLQQEVVMKTVRASGASGYIQREESPNAIDFAESIEELETWARRRLRRDHARTLTISHRMVPFLRVGDFVRVTCRRKGIFAVDGYVTETRRTLDVLNGGARQTTIVQVPPSWV